jgi:hypothetical protein
MTPADRARLRELAARATPGEWQYVDELVAVMNGPGDPVCESGAGSGGSAAMIAANGEFIAAARTAVPELLDALDAAERRVEALAQSFDDALNAAREREAECERLRAALREIVTLRDLDEHNYGDHADDMENIARRALAGGSDG